MIKKTYVATFAILTLCLSATFLVALRTSWKSFHPPNESMNRLYFERDQVLSSAFEGSGAPRYLIIRKEGGVLTSLRKSLQGEFHK